MLPLPASLHHAPPFPPFASRENSARKEGVPILARYLQRCQPGSAADQAAPAEAPAAAEAGQGAEAAPEEPPTLAAVKVACRGVVALKVAAHPAAAAPAASAAAGNGGGGDASAAAGGAEAAGAAEGGFDAAAATWVLRAAAALLADVEGGSRGRLQHVQRVVPVQTTCPLNDAALRRAGAQLAGLVAAAEAAEEPGRGGSGQALADAAGEQQQAAQTQAAQQEEQAQQRKLTFGISVKMREGEAVGSGSLGRGGVIAGLAAGFESALQERHGIAAAVDLKSPAWVLVVEVVPTGSGLYAALGALPGTLCTTKPKLLMRVRLEGLPCLHVGSRMRGGVCRLGERVTAAHA